MTTLEPGYSCEGDLVNPEITPMAEKQRLLEEGCGILSPDFDIPVGNLENNDNVPGRFNLNNKLSLL